ncbi:restriction endonuclease subunit S [Mobiluncus mulieris]|uniref:Restriction endonuclease subunit S n=2 Tax=Mobiluncus mulieris TaxID=2052 RepID=A0A7Y0YGV9_9ACTO|nr:restriction endonuclease subunit S [Mobiluncus mulieris]
MVSQQDSWRTLTVKDVIVKHKGGGTPSKSNPKYWGGNIPWASIKDLKSPRLAHTKDTITEAGLNSSSTNLIPPGAVIVGMRMGVGKLTINDVPVAINQDLRALIPDPVIQAEFLMLALSGATFEGTGATVKGIKLSQLLETEIKVPSKNEQTEILHRVAEIGMLIDRLAELERERERI